MDLNKEQEMLYYNLLVKYSFSEGQKRIIYKGIIDDVDVTIYAKPKYDWGQMDEIRKGLKDKLNINLYSNPKYDWSEMKEIRLELQGNK